MRISRRLVVGWLGLSANTYGKPAAHHRFVGVWHLVSCERKFKDGRVDFPYGAKPMGRITYDKAGRMSAQLMRPGRRSTIPSGVSLTAGGASIEEIREAVTGFIAYYGKFEVDESRQTVIHHVQACLIPSWVDTDLRRTYRFYSNRLLLTAASTDSVIELTWEREAD